MRYGIEGIDELLALALCGLNITLRKGITRFCLLLASFELIELLFLLVQGVSGVFDSCEATVGIRLAFNNFCPCAINRCLRIGELRKGVGALGVELALAAQNLGEALIKLMLPVGEFLLGIGNLLVGFVFRFINLGVGIGFDASVRARSRCGARSSTRSCTSSTRSSYAAE